MTLLSTRFQHPFYADDVINLSITDILDTQTVGRLFTGSAAQPVAPSLPFAVTPDLRLFILTTARAGLPVHTSEVERIRFDVACPPATNREQSIRLCGRWSPITEASYDEGLDCLARRFPTVDASMGTFAHYRRLPLILHQLTVEHLTLVDNVMFGTEAINSSVVRLTTGKVSAFLAAV